jgi:predicted Zn-dependent protease
MRSEIFKKKLEASPDNDLFRFSYGQALYSEGNATDAVEVLKKCVEKKTDWMIAQLIIGKAYLEIGNKETAKTALTAAMDAAIAQNHMEPREEIQSLLAQC